METETEDYIPFEETKHYETFLDSLEGSTPLGDSYTIEVPESQNYIG